MSNALGWPKDFWLKYPSHGHTDIKGGRSGSFSIKSPREMAAAGQENARENSLSACHCHKN